MRYLNVHASIGLDLVISDSLNEVLGAIEKYRDNLVAIGEIVI